MSGEAADTKELDHPGEPLAPMPDIDWDAHRARLSEVCESVQQRYENFLPRQLEEVRREKWRYHCMEGEPGSKAKEDFRRLWQYREDYLRPHEIKIVKNALRNDSSRSNVRAHTDWLKHMRDLRSDAGEGS